MTRWILVVEDEPPLGEMICDNLNSEGYGTELIRDGEQALERLLKGGFDLVLLDIMLPGRDGFEVLAEMRKRDDTTPVLVLSARSTDDDRITIHRPGGLSIDRWAGGSWTASRTRTRRRTGTSPPH